MDGERRKALDPTQAAPTQTGSLPPVVSRRVGSVSEMAAPPSDDRRGQGGALAVLTGHADLTDGQPPSRRPRWDDQAAAADDAAARRLPQRQVPELGGQQVLLRAALGLMVVLLLRPSGRGRGGAGRGSTWSRRDVHAAQVEAPAHRPRSDYRDSRPTVAVGPGWDLHDAA